MSLLLRASEVARLPVVTIDGGEDVAEVRDVVYDPDEGVVVGLTLNQRGWLRGRMREVLSAASIAAVGPAAVMIAGRECLESPESAPPEVGRPPGGRNVMGNRVLTEGGVQLGTVTDLILQVGRSLEVVGYELQVGGGKDKAFIPLPAQLAVSGEALVVPNATEEFVRHDLTGFGGAVEEFRHQLPGGSR